MSRGHPSERLQKLTAEAFGHGRADDLAHWRSDASASVVIERRPGDMDRRARKALFLLARGEGESAGELLRADADEAELAVPGILAVVEEGQE